MMAVVFNRWSSAMQMIGFPPSLFEQKKNKFYGLRWYGDVAGGYFAEAFFFSE